MFIVVDCADLKYLLVVGGGNDRLGSVFQAIVS
jgi:hypothetical protein